MSDARNACSLWAVSVIRLAGFARPGAFSGCSGLRREVDMVSRGVGDIKGLHSLTTAVGQLTERKGYLKLYQLAAEKDSLRRKLEWVWRQKGQTEGRLCEIVRTMRTVEDRMRRELVADTEFAARLHQRFSGYS
jgi:hypothetical protein